MNLIHCAVTVVAFCIWLDHLKVTGCSTSHSQLSGYPFKYFQNHRAVGVRRDLRRSFSPTLLLRGSLEQVAQENVQEGFEYLKRRLYNCSGQPVPVLCNP